jgi:hypothetical protein
VSEHFKQEWGAVVDWRKRKTGVRASSKQASHVMHGANQTHSPDFLACVEVSDLSFQPMAVHALHLADGQQQKAKACHPMPASLCSLAAQISDGNQRK